MCHPDGHCAAHTPGGMIKSRGPFSDSTLRLTSWLLPSSPDQVHTVPLRRGRPSTPLSTTETGRSQPRKGIRPGYGGLPVTGNRRLPIYHGQKCDLRVRGESAGGASTRSARTAIMLHYKLSIPESQTKKAAPRVPGQERAMIPGSRLVLVLVLVFK